MQPFTDESTHDAAMTSPNQEEELEDAIRRTLLTIDLVRDKFFPVHVRVRLSEINLRLFVRRISSKADGLKGLARQEVASAAFELVHNSLTDGLISQPIFFSSAFMMDEAQARDYASALLASAAIRRQLRQHLTPEEAGCYWQDLCQGRCLLDRLDDNFERVAILRSLSDQVYRGVNADKIRNTLDSLSNDTCHWYFRTQKLGH